MRVDDAITQLRQQRASIRCDDLIRLLTDLGFVVHPTKTPGHKIVTHPDIKDLRSNFDCGHGRTPQPKTVYVDAMRRLLTQYRDELAQIEKKADHQSANEESKQ